MFEPYRSLKLGARRPADSLGPHFGGASMGPPGARVGDENAARHGRGKPERKPRGLRV